MYLCIQELNNAKALRLKDLVVRVLDSKYKHLKNTIRARRFLYI